MSRRIVGHLWRRWQCARLPHIGQLSELLPRIPSGVCAISLDCFDTLLHRRIDPPEAPLKAWAERVADRLAWTRMPLSADNVLSHRTSCEAQLRAEASDRAGEITLATLHAKLGELLEIDPQALISLEESCERSVLQVAPGVLDVLQQLRGQGYKLAILSDMYWEESRLARLLMEMGVAEQEDIVLVSGSQGANKYEGALFSVLLEQTMLKPTQVIHVGDHFISDCATPISKGISAYWLQDKASLSRRARLRGVYRGVKSPLAILDREYAPASPPPHLDAACYSIGRDILGPALALFVHSALVRIGRSCGGKPATIGFLARDGWLLMRIAERMRQEDARLQSLLAPVRFVYLHLSRRSCWPAGGDDPLASLARLADGLSVHGTMRALARLLALTDSDIEELLSSCEILDIKLRDLKDRDAALRIWFDQPQVLQRLLLRRNEARTALIGYLTDQGIYGCPHIPLHMLDLGWYSSIQITLAQAFASDARMPSVTGHLLGNGRVERSLHPSGRSLLAPGYIVDAACPSREDADIFRAIGLLEISCQTQEGSTVGYERIGNQWMPSCGPVPDVSHQFRSSMQSGVLERAKYLLPWLSGSFVPTQALVVESRKRIARFITRPTLAEAQAFSSAHFDVDIGTTARVPCVDDTLDIRDLCPPTRMLRRIRHVAWPEGSLAASHFIGGKIMHRAWLTGRYLQRKLSRR